ncbi:MAG: sulfatase-like hydrolase/transferase [Pseudomonadota bacterium]
MQIVLKTLLACSALFVASCGQSGPVQSHESERPHIVILLADDLGIDVAPCHSQTVRMPFLESLCDRSVVLERAYTHPVCTPSRATLMTSRHPYEHGANNVAQSARKLALEETTLAERFKALDSEPYSTAGFGKWHLSDDENGGLDSPNLQGFDFFEGTPRQHQTYAFWDFDWWRNGELIEESVPTYRTTFIVDRVLDYFKASQDQGPQFIYVGFTNPHLPFHLPPAELHAYEEMPPPPKRGPLKQPAQPGFYQANRRDARLDPYFFAMLESLDHEIQRLVVELQRESDRPILFLFAGDNGTSPEVYQGDTSAGYRAKGTLYEGGAAVPIQIWESGNELGLEYARSAKLFHFADIGPTLLSFAGATREQTDAFERETSGIALADAVRGGHQEHHDLIYLERGTINGAPFAFGSVDQEGFKLIVWEKEEVVFPAIEGFFPSQIEFYDIKNDPGEVTNLFETCEANFSLVQRHFDFIQRELGKARGSDVPFDSSTLRTKISAQSDFCTQHR